MRRNHGSIRGIAAATICVPIIAVTGCHVGSPELASPGIHQTRDGVPYVKPGHPVSVGELSICLTRPGKVTITSVEPVDPVGKIIVQAYAVRPNNGQFLGDVQGTLDEHGFSGSHLVDGVCDPNDGYTSYQLGLQLTKPTRADVGAACWDVSYQTDAGHSKTLRLPLAVALCDGVAWKPACAKIDPLS